MKLTEGIIEITRGGYGPSSEQELAVVRAALERLEEWDERARYSLTSSYPAATARQLGVLWCGNEALFKYAPEVFSVGLSGARYTDTPGRFLWLAPTPSEEERARAIFYLEELAAVIAGDFRASCLACRQRLASIGPLSPGQAAALVEAHRQAAHREPPDRRRIIIGGRLFGMSRGRRAMLLRSIIAALLFLFAALA